MIFEILDSVDLLRPEEIIDIRGGVSDVATEREEDSCNNCSGGNCNVFDSNHQKHD